MHAQGICEGIHCWSNKVETHLFPVMDILRNCGLIWNIDDNGLLADNHEVLKPANCLDSNFEIAMDTVQNTCALLLVACRVATQNSGGVRETCSLYFIQILKSRLCYYTMLKRVVAHNHRNCIDGRSPNNEPVHSLSWFKFRNHDDFCDGQGTVRNKCALLLPELRDRTADWLRNEFFVFHSNFEITAYGTMLIRVVST